ncbi:MAG: hypothetical protein ACRDFT_01840 [bacterium]
MKREGKPRSSGTYLWIAFGLLAVAAFVGIMISAASRPKAEGAVVGDHWHAQFALVVCEKALPPFPVSSGGVHTHGDGLIHIHPANAAEGGRNANLGRFLASVGVRLTPTSLQLPDGTVHRNGDTCPDGKAGTMHLLINGKDNDAWNDYVLRDRDVVVIEFR